MSHSIAHVTPARNRLLSVADVHKEYGAVRAVDGVSFDVHAGEIVALLGPNGAGKTTLIRMLVGLTHPDRGAVAYHVDGKEQSMLPAPALGYLPEERGLYQDVSTARTLAYFGRLRGMSRSDAARAAAAWLERFALADRANEPLKALSKGNQQKVQFASAVLHRPRFAILDEPFSGLDPLNQDLFVRTIHELREGGTTVLLSAHQMQLVERLADRVILLSRGREVLRGTIAELRRKWSAGQRLVVRLASEADPSALAGHPAVRQVERTAADELTVLTDDDTPLSELLVAIGSRYAVTSLHAEQLPLHDIYVRSVEASLGDGARPASVANHGAHR
ncbi:MAG TPA: ATP-binding cassette domain-containing protein [Gemmatimonadaceae bacterium]|nr:ATP-binding cassette domain-containing protein [Gemmatimonadaceae bacterium]